MSRTIEHDIFLKRLRETTRMLREERMALELGLKISGRRNGRLVVRVPARMVERQP